jgi:hypothetical protein
VTTALDRVMFDLWSEIFVSHYIQETIYEGSCANLDFEISTTYNSIRFKVTGLTMIKNSFLIGFDDKLTVFF